MLNNFNFVFIDTKGEFADEINTLFSCIDNVVGLTMNVQDYKSNGRIFYVSPANSFGFMDGGIDKIYSRRMFRDVEDRVKYVVSRMGKYSKLGRRYIPIGSAFIVPADDSNKNFMISAPTMLLPQNVEGTNNAYFAMVAVLNVIHTYQPAHFSDIVIPGLCTGYGGISYKESAKQIFKAFMDFNFGIHITKNLIFRNNFCYISEPNLKEQPNNYQNREFK